MKKNVVIIGGGFAGSTIAKKLEKNFYVTLIDTKEYFEFTPGILRTIVKPTHIKKIQVLHSHYLRWAKTLIGKVKEIGKNYVLLNKKKIKFDYLCICSGSDYNLPFKEQSIMTPVRATHLRECYQRLCEAEKILIVGGGLVGVELAGEICDAYKGKKVTIVHSKNKLIERNNQKAAKSAQKHLEKRGVKILLNERVVQSKKGRVITNKGTKIKADIIFLCTGISPNYGFIKKNFSSCLNEKGFAKTNKFLQLYKMKNIFVAGDLSEIKEEKTAQNAERQAKTVVHNIFALENKEKLSEYKPRTTPLVISLGKYNAIFAYGNFTLTGKIPAAAKWLIEKNEMIKKRKI